MADETKAAAKPADKKKVAVGDTVQLVLANGEHVPAEVVKVRTPDLVDLKFTFRDGEQTITSSPFDAAGKLSDSWS